MVTYASRSSYNYIGLLQYRSLILSGPIIPDSLVIKIPEKFNKSFFKIFNGGKKPVNDEGSPDMRT